MPDDAVPGPYADDEPREVRRPGRESHVIDLAARRRIPVRPAEVAVLSPAGRLLVDAALTDLRVRLGAATTCAPAYSLLERGDGRLTLSFIATVDVVGLNAHAETLAKEK